MMGFGRTLRNLGSRASAPAVAKANAVSLGNNRPRLEIRHSGGGSSAGLNAQKSARLEMDGTGYRNPLIQRGKDPVKRYPKSSWSHNHPGAPRPNGKVSDYRKPKTLLD